MALALYRKYRPRTFAEIIGQEHVTEPLSQALRSDRLHHAYLFSGPRGCGKTSSARILARSLNCEKGPTPDPCGECESCRALAPDGAGSIDVIEIDAASHGGVDDARDLRERAFFAPVSSRFKIYVIDEAHMVSSAGFNALLKLVEEPPEYVKFVFATTEPEKVLGTIKSRTHHYPFRLIPPGVLRPYLEQMCVTEGVAVEPAVFPLVVRAGGGSARDSLSVLDQLIAGAGPEGVKYSRAVALLGVTDVALIDEVCDALAAGDGRAVYTTIDRVAEAGHDARRFAGDLLERLRDLIVLQHVPDAVSKGLLDGADDELARMTVQASQFGAATLSRMADIVHTGLTDMRGTTAPRLVLELITARMLLPGSDDSTSALLARMERMERRLTLSGDDEAAFDAPSASARPRSVSAPPAATVVAEQSAAVAPAQSAAIAPAPASSVSSSAASGGDAPPWDTGSSASGSGLAGGPGSASESGPAGRSASVAGSASPTRAGVAAPAPEPPSTHGADHLRGEASAATSPDGAPAARRSEGPPGAIDAAAVRRIWEEVITMVRRKSPRAAAVVREATVREVDGDVLVLTFKHAFHAEAVAASPGLLIDAVYEVLGGRWRVRCEVTGQSTQSPTVGAGGSRAVAASNSGSTGRESSDGGQPANHPNSGDGGPAGAGNAGGPLGASGSGPSGGAATGAIANGLPETGQATLPAARADTGDARGLAVGSGSGDAGSGRAETVAGESSLAGSSGGGSRGTASEGVRSAGPSGSESSGAGSAGGPSAGDSSGAGSAGMRSAGSSGSEPSVAGSTGMRSEGSGDNESSGGGSTGRSTGAGPGGSAATGARSTRSGSAGAASTSRAPISATPSSTGSSAQATTVEEDWPTTATLGGSGADGGVAPVAEAPPVVPGARRGASGAAAAASAREKARAAAAGRGGAAGRPAVPTPAGREDAWAGSGVEEPPYDPEFDAPVRDAVAEAHVGFDPGDEPVDDDGDPASRQTSEQQAVDLLRDSLGAERIS